jgi:flap endonuclease-1
LFNRTIRFLSEGIRPVYVFDGKPPTLKSGELQKRRERREQAETSLKIAQEEGNVEEEEKQSKRLVRAGQKENEDCKKLLRLMGVPVVVAPCEAEAQASAMARAGLVYAVGTEDMDALTFQAPVLLRKMTFANASKSDIQTMNYNKALEGLGLTQDQFVDLCILLGCDYCDTIRGVGPKTALKLIREHKCIEEILKHLDDKKYGIPDTWIPNNNNKRHKQKKDTSDDDDGYDTNPEEEGNDNHEVGNGEDETAAFVPAFVEARKLFKNHEVITEGLNLKWELCQAEELTQFLVEEMGFNADRVKSNIEKLNKAVQASSKPQMRMENFFKPKEKPPSDTIKRKALEEPKKKANVVANKKGKTTTGKRR